ncbi:MAG: hypothetical protein ACE5ER_03120 [Nitrospinaceae bacterium]
MKRFGFAWMLLIGMTAPALAGAPDIYCPDYYGRLVKWVENKDMRKVAEAQYLPNGSPVIFFNPDAAAASGVSRDTLRFFQLQECAHLVLGHMVRPAGDIPSFVEQVDQADCWAANKFWYAGEKKQIKGVEDEINSLPQKTWMYLGGPVRILHLADNCRFKEPVWPKFP